MERSLPVFFPHERGEGCRGRRRRLDVQRSHALDKRVAVFARHGDIREQHVDVLTLQDLKRLRRRGGSPDRGLAAFEARCHHLPGLRIVVETRTERPCREALDRALNGQCRAETSGLVRGHRDDRQPDGKRGAASLATAFNANTPAVRLDEVLDDGQTESETAIRPRRRRIRLQEGLEDPRQELGSGFRCRCR